MTSSHSSQTSIAPSTPLSPAAFKTVLYHPSTHALPPAHVAALRTLINPAFRHTEGGTFVNPRIPDEEAKELLTAGRWIFCLYSLGGTGLPAAKDHEGVVHDLDGWGLVGTVSLSKQDEKEEWHVHLLATSLEYPKAGFGARLLAECERFVRDEKEERKVLVAVAIKELGLGFYYQRRGFREEGEDVVMPVGAWGSIESFTLVRMVKVL
jgi:GNAT superfamily N-acetyltransferase